MLYELILERIGSIEDKKRLFVASSLMYSCMFLCIALSSGFTTAFIHKQLNFNLVNNSYIGSFIGCLVSFTCSMLVISEIQKILIKGEGKLKNRIVYASIIGSICYGYLVSDVCLRAYAIFGEETYQIIKACLIDTLILFGLFLLLGIFGPRILILKTAYILTVAVLLFLFVKVIFAITTGINIIGHKNEYILDIVLIVVIGLSVSSKVIQLESFYERNGANNALSFAMGFELMTDMITMFLRLLRRYLDSRKK